MGVVDELEIMGYAPVIVLLNVPPNVFEQNFIQDEFYVEGTEPNNDGVILEHTQNSYKLLLTVQGFEMLAQTTLVSQIELDEPIIMK